MTILSLAILAVVLALVCVTLWNALAWARVGGRALAAADSSVSVLIPARDEAGNLAACLDSALAQGAIVGEVLVYDDHSTDATPDIVSTYARRDARVRLAETRELPAGWCGK